MRISVTRPFACTAAVASLALIALTGCSNGPSISGPSWNLTGSRTSVTTPPKVMSAPVSQDASTPQPVYRGGRDPVTGRAAAEGPIAPQAPTMPPTTIAAATPPPAALAPRAAPAPVPQTTAPTASAPPAATPSAVPTSAPAAAGTNQRPQVVEVQQGDSLAKIAAQYKVSIASLMQANKLRDPYISPGQWLVLPKR